MTDEDTTNFYALMDGGLYDLAHVNPLVRETVFRFAADDLGLDPGTDTTFVARRGVAMGGIGVTATTSSIPSRRRTSQSPSEKKRTVAARPPLGVPRRYLEAAKVALTDATPPSLDQEPAGMHRQKKTLVEDGPSVNRNTFKEMYLNFAQIDEQFELRTHYDTELKQL